MFRCSSYLSFLERGWSHARLRSKLISISIDREGAPGMDLTFILFAPLGVGTARAFASVAPYDGRFTLPLLVCDSTRRLTRGAKAWTLRVRTPA